MKFCDKIEISPNFSITKVLKKGSGLLTIDFGSEVLSVSESGCTIVQGIADDYWYNEQGETEWTDYQGNQLNLA
jgi:hypothetical protein